MPEPCLPVKKRLEIIQVLRFFAALTVVGVHLPTVGAGTWGVDIFFIISGFVIVYTATFDREYFFRKRLIRIVPIYWLMTFSVFAAALIYPRVMNNTTPDVVELLKSLFFIPFYKSGTALQPLLYVGWTINCEMIFYAIFGVALAVSKKHTTIVASILIAALVLLGITFKDAGAIADFYGNMIFFEFPLGMALCHWWFATERGGPTFRRASAALCMAGLTAWFVLYQLGYWETGVRVLDYGVPSFFFVGAALFTFREAKMPWLLVLLGDASYSLYLLHPFPVIASNKVFKLYNGTLLEDWLWSAAVTAACLAASVVMYKGFELPMQRFLRGHLLPPRQKPSLTPPLEHGPIDEARA